MTINKVKHKEGRKFKSFPSRPFTPFHIRWNEPLGILNKPYMKRYVINLWLFSIRLHIWYAGDDTRYMHNHAFNFITIVLKGGYTDVTQEGSEWLPAGSIRYRQANHLHYVYKPLKPTITLLFCGKPKQKWGFWVNNRIMRPLRYFSRYGHENTHQK